MLSISLLLVLTLVIGTVAAYEPRKDFKLNLVEKNPIDWSVVTNGASGYIGGYEYYKAVWEPYYIWGYMTNRVTYVNQGYVYGSFQGLEPNTDYTLVYYGSESNNDVWPYSTCIKQIKSTFYGSAYLPSTEFNFGPMLTDNINQKIWLVKSSDVNCTKQEMTAWNPTEYLFEMKTI